MKMGVLKIKEAIEMAKSKGVKITQMKIARKIWPDSTPAAQRVNMYNLVNGETARVSPDWIKIISKAYIAIFGNGWQETRGCVS